MPDKPPTSDPDIGGETTPMPPDGVESVPAADDSTGSDDPKRSTGEMLGEFKLLRRLGQGGMAEVWLAEQTSLHRNVALKLLRHELTVDETYIKRFETEAKAAAGLNHPNIVQVYVVGSDRGQHFIAQEYVQGQTLRTLLRKKGPLEVPLALHLIRQVAAALQAASERGIVHRDIKPENIMITKKGEAKVADFGLAQLTLSSEPLNLTQEGITMGTPLYMSPEQVNGKSLDSRSDLYSFGVTCYHMLTGRPPYQGETAVSVAVQHLQGDAEPLNTVRPDLPQPLCQLVQRMMQRDPDERYQSPAAVLDDVRTLIKALKNQQPLDEITLSGESRATQKAVTRPSGLSWWMIALAVVLVIGCSAALGWLQRPGIPDQSQVSSTPAVNELESAREQYLHAMFLGDDEEAWLAVQAYFPDEKLWVDRSREQLALLYLKDPRRYEDARRILERMESRRREDESYYAKARAGLAALLAYQGNLTQARTILSASQVTFRKHLTGSWRDLVDETRRMIDESSDG
ncbi:Serine/threonine-protein kinase PrkC [Maioricimonas rarisocia]|uniref:non-specific serine/threonine protein kinase n=1 Tax=Maioricimonas rarisocia TaxID=2528026 RepID=A0A517Z1F7_9PLAN|nr:serine/threonine-protein kinase [Maioricimonas rarisocia]QDU36320.1 Serine/threonine-protein kinase PrkC [Maioricimonas rarisocia]